MEIFFKSSFIKDLDRLPKKIRKEIKKICLEIFPRIEDIKDFKEYRVKAITGFKNYYRIKIGHYRIGVKKENHSILFMRVIHRKDIYKYFP